MGLRGVTRDAQQIPLGVPEESCLESLIRTVDDAVHALSWIVLEDHSSLPEYRNLCGHVIYFPGGDRPKFMLGTHADGHLRPVTGCERDPVVGNLSEWGETQNIDVDRPGDGCSRQ